MEITDLVGLDQKACLVAQLQYVEGYDKKLAELF